MQTNGGYPVTPVPSSYYNGYDAVYDQDFNIYGQASVFSPVQWRGPAHLSNMPIFAYGMRPLQRDDLTAYRAAWIPHSGNIPEPQPSGAGGRHHANSDIAFVALKAPKF
jgi:hypothetical protein